jgi:RHS repeat-associated protein
MRLWHHADAQGSVIARSGGTGALPAAAERFTYTPYGVTGPGSGTAQEGFRWLGRRLEPAAPGALYDMRARAYAAGLGRFLQPDPIGTEGGVNLYAYARNTPLTLRDPSGTSPVETGSDHANVLPAAARRDPVTGAGPGTTRTQPLPEGLGGGGSRPQSFTPPGAGRSGALNEAKRLNGIPVGQQPTRTIPNTDRAGNPQPGRAYIYEVPGSGGGTRQIIIREDARGYFYGPGNTQNRGPHFNDPQGRHFDYRRE